MRCGDRVEIDAVARTQAMWWVASLMASRDGVRIPDPRGFVAEASINISPVQKKHFQAIRARSLGAVPYIP